MLLYKPFFFQLSFLYTTIWSNCDAVLVASFYWFSIQSTSMEEEDEGFHQKEYSFLLNRTVEKDKNLAILCLHYGSSIFWMYHKESRSIIVGSGVVNLFCRRQFCNRHTMIKWHKCKVIASILRENVCTYVRPSFRKKEQSSCLFWNLIKVRSLLKSTFLMDK